MKKLLFVLTLIAMVATASNAQEWKFGGGLTLGTEMGIDDDGSSKMGFGLNVRADYALNDQFSIAPGFSYFFPSTPKGYDLNAWQLNADAHYYFYSTEGFNIYGIGGLNYSSTKSKFDLGDYDLGGFEDLVDDFGFDTDNEVTDNTIGLDLGVGANFGSMFFGELKYDTAFEQVAITVGVLF